jgi:DNA-directed RNA polymerase omega subunit
MDENKYEMTEENDNQNEVPKLDSHYRLILVAAQRSKQLQRGARARVSFDASKHKPTRVALEEVKSGQVPFEINKED